MSGQKPAGIDPARHPASRRTMTTRLVRLLKIMRAIEARPGVQRWELAEQFDVSTRRMQEDLAILRAAGVPVVRIGRGYELAGDVPTCADGHADDRDSASR